MSLENKEIFNNLYYFPDKEGITIYDISTKKKLLKWLKMLFDKSADKIINREVLKKDNEKKILINFIINKTNELFEKVILSNDNKIHKNTVKYLFISCFYITFKLNTCIDYEILYKNENDKYIPSLNFKCLSKAIPGNDTKKKINIFYKMEKDIMEFTNWCPFTIL